MRLLAGLVVIGSSLTGCLSLDEPSPSIGPTLPPPSIAPSAPPRDQDALIVAVASYPGTAAATRR